MSVTVTGEPKVLHVIVGSVLLVTNLAGGWLASVRAGAENNVDAALYAFSSAVLLPLTIVLIGSIWKSQRNSAGFARNFMLGGALSAISNYGLLFA